YFCVCVCWLRLELTRFSIIGLSVLNSLHARRAENPVVRAFIPAGGGQLRRGAQSLRYRCRSGIAGALRPPAAAARTSAARRLASYRLQRRTLRDRVLRG